jgi:hypothetical protein
MNPFFLSNFGILETKISDTLYNSLIEETKLLQFRKNTRSGISGNHVATHYKVENNENELTQYLNELALQYDSSFNYLKSLRVLDRDLPMKVSALWFNVQKKTEFIPMHTHDGVLSFVIWLKIPYEIEHELSNDSRYESCFQFVYSSITGTIINETIKVDKSMEKTILVFPSILPHCVYPFYTSDDVRISLSGNIVLDTRG